MINSNKEANIADSFKIDIIMSKLRTAINKNQLKLDEYEEIIWLLKLVLKSNEFFSSTKEVDNFLGNICGFAHDTKSTGRDRIVDWYFRELSKIEDGIRQETVKKIAKYTFAFIPNDYTEWKNLLMNKKGVK